MGAPFLAPGFSEFRGFLAEGYFTFIFVLVIWANLVDNGKWSYISVFSVASWVAVMIISIGALTGGAMNPARAFGPTLINGSFESEHWIYLAGPLVGGTAAGLLYKFVFETYGDYVDGIC